LSWLDQQVSLYRTHTDNIGCPATLREVLFVPSSHDKRIITALRNLDKRSPTYQGSKKELKSKLSCFTPSGLLKTKKAGHMSEISRTGLLQLDFDHQDISEYDLSELKNCVFRLPFIAYCGLSCSGDGFYALALISEPYKLKEYAEHIFLVLNEYGIKADQSKGKKVENLRYVSCYADELYRETPEALYVTNFKANAANKTKYWDMPYRNVLSTKNGLISSSLNQIKNATIGNRWSTVQKVAYTLGGLGQPSILDLIKNEIKTNSQFKGMNEKYMKCAEDCFVSGQQKPLKH
jgi:hypothetical protein